MPVVRRYLDPQTRDYVLVRGAPSQDDTVVSEAVLRLVTPLGSFVPDPTFGSRFFEIKKLVRETAARANVYFALALQPMIRKGALRSVSPACFVEGSILVIEGSLVTSSGDPRTVRIERST